MLWDSGAPQAPEPFNEDENSNKLRGYCSTAQVVSGPRNMHGRSGVNKALKSATRVVDSCTKNECVVYVERAFRRRFGDNRDRGPVPTRKIILSWWNKWKESGSVRNVKRTGSMKTVRTPENTESLENKVLGKIFEAKRDEVTGEWRKLHNTELYALYSSPDIIRNIKSRHLRWAGHVARMGDSRNAYGVCAAQQLNASQSTHRFSFVNHTIKTVNMPKVRHSVNLKSKLTSYISEFKEDGLSTDNKILFCNLCQCAVSSTQKFLVQQHITTSKHQANKQLNSKQRQLFLTQPTTSNVRSEFNIDLCRSLISADIPLYKLKNKVFREFLEKYTQHTIPDESTLRKTYAPSIYDETIQKIRDEIKDSSIWVSIDETPDKEGRLVGNVVIGLLSEQYSERILLHCDVLEKCNNKTIVKLFNEAMVKKVFLKAPSRVNVLKEMYPEIPLPPKPILTRWGTWLEAVEYYAEHIDSINNVLLALDSEDAVSIDTAKTVTCDISVKNDLAHIQHTFSCIIKTLKSLQNRHLSLSESFEIINSTVEQLNRGRGKVADAVRAKVDTVLSKNPGYEELQKGCCCDEW
ncbi:hypothetical protein ANN_21079 [Periplaneta americana]|uniref:DUF659 domain-containing protein n=1 Tax=Periplaneta americana TaxID=6978 RepID=A0ABQ8SEH5_PERAM|nr:hypothetical protein ANN_21079 [Periplaneta americana]